jgi:hypothetical protein
MVPLQSTRRLLVSSALAVLSYASAIAQEAITVSGHGFEIGSLQNGAVAFGNRHYVWQHVPTWLTGWRYTKVQGGKPAEMWIHANTEADVYLATVEAPPEGWQPANDGSDFAYNDKYQTTLRIYGRHLTAGETTAVPQRGWAGDMVLAPNISSNVEYVPVGYREPRTHVDINEGIGVETEVVVKRTHHHGASRAAKREIRRETKMVQRQAHQVVARRSAVPQHSQHPVSVHRGK